MAPGERKTTRRQREFLRALIALWKRDDMAVHYTDLAKRIGVNRYSAYDMLRVLESKGLAEAHYSLDRDSQPAGRSSVYYMPTAAGLREIAPARAATLPDEWYTFRGFLLGRLRAAQSNDDEQLLSDLMEQIPLLRSPLLYCSQVITVLLLHLDRARDRIMGMPAIDALKALIGESHETSLSLVAGLSLGTGLSGASDRGQVQQLFDYTRTYQQLLQELSTEGKKLLSGFLEDAMTAMGRSETYSGGETKGEQHG